MGRFRYRFGARGMLGFRGLHDLPGLLVLLVLPGLFSLLAPAGAAAQTSFNGVDTQNELRQAILSLSGDFAKGLDNGPYTIHITGNIVLTQSLPMIRATLPFGGAVHVTIEGNGHTIDANNTGRALFVASGRVAIRNVTIANARAAGGPGGWSAIGGGGGGGLGAGAALFVNDSAVVTTTNLTVQDASAIGGKGGDYGADLGSGENSMGGGGGGGLGGNGGNVNQLGSPETTVGGGGGGGYAASATGGSTVASSWGGGGGGGEFGSGATAGGPANRGGAGGGGRLAPGGVSSSLGGGGGGGATLGGAHNLSGSAQVAGGGAEGGYGGASNASGGPGLALGGGGGGGQTGFGGNGGTSGGGGGGGNLRAGGAGGSGGGGGGGGHGATGGAGGEFGGGGGGGESSFGGDGGFGGGGGGSNMPAGAGLGGFGAGSGGSGQNSVVAGGHFGGSGTYGGGGGAALGGAVFVRSGGSLTLTDGAFAGTFTVTPGAGGEGGAPNGATAGEAYGTTFFLMAGAGAPTTFDITASNTRTIAGDDALAGDGGFVKAGTGTLVLSGINTYSGATVVNGGTLAVNGSITSPVTVNAGSTLGGSGTIGSVTVNASATIAPGAAGGGPGILSATNVTFSSGSNFVVELNGATAGAGYDRLAVSGVASLNNATLTVTPGYSATPGAAFTILTNATGTFAGLTEGALLAAGSLHFRVTYTGGDGNDVVLTAELAAPPPPPPMTYYLAEGATGSFFDTDLLLANPQSTDVPVVIEFLRDDGVTIVRNQTLPALSRRTIRVDDTPGLESAAVSTRVTSPGGAAIVVERTMRWDASAYGAHTEKATAGVALEWYFAEGAQGFFSTFVLLVNPHTAANTAHITWLREGEPALARDYALPPSSRVTIDAGADPELAGRAFGARVVFDQPGAAERAMYFGTAPLWSSGHASAGATTPATHWLLAEGATGSFFTTFVLVANPNDDPATLTFTYLPATGQPVTKTHTVAGRQRLTINIALEDLSLASAAVSTDVQSTLPVVVERAQYWPNPAWHEAHNSFGVTSAATTWGLAEGRVGGPRQEQTYILLANGGTQSADVTVSFLRESGAPIVKTFTVNASSRFNVAVAGAGSDVPELSDEAFGARIDSTQPIVVERSVYSDANGITWAAGTNATATRLP